MEKKGYKPPPLKIILNGLPKDGFSNVERAVITSNGVAISLGLIGLLHLSHNLHFSVIPALYLLEMGRQAILAFKK